MAVLEKYSYTDSQGHSLTADAGFRTDGASIPRALWTVVGSPFTGKYVGAAVVHDVGCVTHKYSWQVTHRMFYTAMRELGVSADYAKILYWGVRLGGPKWEERNLQAKSVAELKAEVKRETGAHLNDALIQRRPLRGGTVYESTVQIPVENPTSLSIEDANRIAAYVRKREPSAVGSVTLDEIDQRTPLSGPLPADAIPIPIR